MQKREVLALAIVKVKRKNNFNGNILKKESSGRVLQKRCSRTFGKFYSKAPAQEPFFKKKFQAVGLQLYFKRCLCIGFFSVKCLKLFRTAFLY